VSWGLSDDSARNVYDAIVEKVQLAVGRYAEL